MLGPELLLMERGTQGINKPWGSLSGGAYKDEYQCLFSQV